eukprot:GHVU01137897.1.p1 GENE.GHVU01137897.1~~GHVU01137897.1.p1  ORF type:complete len:273 (+),score=43.71 GHVU01137897.1:98-916(+)
MVEVVRDHHTALLDELEQRLMLLSGSDERDIRERSGAESMVLLHLHTVAHVAQGLVPDRFDSCPDNRMNRHHSGSGDRVAGRGGGGNDPDGYEVVGDGAEDVPAVFDTPPASSSSARMRPFLDRELQHVYVCMLPSLVATLAREASRAAVKGRTTATDLLCDPRRVSSEKEESARSSSCSLQQMLQEGRLQYPPEEVSCLSRCSIREAMRNATAATQTALPQVGSDAATPTAAVNAPGGGESSSLYVPKSRVYAAALTSFVERLPLQQPQQP